VLSFSYKLRKVTNLPNFWPRKKTMRNLAKKWRNLALKKMATRVGIYYS